MNFDFSPEQKMLRDQARRFLAEACPTDALRRYLADGDATFVDELWRQVGALGWTAVAVSEDHGGLELGALELAVLAEEFGRALAPLPFAATAALAPSLLEGSHASSVALLLEAVASGESRIAFAGLDSPRPALSFEGDRISGSAIVAFNDQIDTLLALAQTRDGPAVVRIDARADGIDRQPLTGLDDLVRHARWRLQGVPAEQLHGGANAGARWERARNHAAVLCAFEQVGGAEKALELARNYALERYTFGRAIGSYQAVKHRLADMAVTIELARSNAWFGAWAMANNAPELALAASTARVSATEAYEFAAIESLHLHGGIGYTWEADCHFHYKRAKWLAVSLGDVGQWSGRTLEALRASPVPA